MKILYYMILNIIFVISMSAIAIGNDISQLSSALDDTPFSQDNFENGTEDWNLADGWSLIEDGGNHLLRGTGHYWAWLSNDLGISWSEYAFRFRVKLAPDSELHANFYSADANEVWHRYFLGIYEGGFGLNRQVGNDFTNLANAEFDLSVNQWHTIGVIVEGNTILTRADGEEVMSHTDDQPLTSGSIAFESLNGSVFVDDVMVSDFYVPICGDGLCEDENLTCSEDCQPPEIYWEPLAGPFHSGHPVALAQNPVNHNELFLVLSEVYHSLNRGVNWTPLQALQGKPITSIAMGENSLFAAGNGVYRYHYLTGQTEEIRPPGNWVNKVFLNGNFLFITSDCQSIGDPNLIMYADITEDVPVWNDISPDAVELDDLVMPDTQFDAVVQVSGLVKVGNRIVAAISVFVDGSMDDINGQLYISDDFGITWIKSALDIPYGRIITALEQDSSDEQHLALGLRNPHQEQLSDLKEMLFESFDGGENWEPATLSQEPIFNISDIDFRSEDIYLTLDYWHQIYRLHQGGVELIDITGIPGFPNWNTGMRQIIFDIDDPEVVYGITSWGFGLVKSEDHMQSWQKIEDGIKAYSPTIVVPHPLDSQVIYTTGNMIQEKYFTFDFGQTWLPFMPDDIRGDEMRVDVHDPDHLIYMSEGTDLFESRDRGVTFQRLPNQFTSAKIFDIEVSSDDYQKIYVSNNGIGISELVWQAPDATEYEWQHLRKSPDYSYVFTVHPEDGNILYAGQSPRVFENQASIYKYDKNSTDMDAEFGWSKLADFDGMTGVTALEINQNDPGILYAGLTGSPGKLMVSPDGGTSWNELNKAFTFSTVHVIITDPQNMERVFAAPWGDGLFASEDAGKSWRKLSIPTISVADILIMPHMGNHMIIGDRLRPNLYESFDGGETWTTLVKMNKKNIPVLVPLAFMRGKYISLSLTR